MAKNNIVFSIIDGRGAVSVNGNSFMISQLDRLVTKVSAKAETVPGLDTQQYFESIRSNDETEAFLSGDGTFGEFEGLKAFLGAVPTSKHAQLRSLLALSPAEQKAARQFALDMKKLKAEKASTRKELKAAHDAAIIAACTKI